MKQEVGRRQQVLEILRAASQAKTVSQLARALRVHGNTVRFHLESLLADGLIEVEPQEGEGRPVGRPAVKYRAVARVAPAQMKHTETLVRLFLGDLAADPGGATRAEEIGRRWGRDRAQAQTAVSTDDGAIGEVRALTSLLTEMGFESDPPTCSEILVKSCPFLDAAQLKNVHDRAAEGQSALPPVCAVHLGVMKGALEEWDAGLDVTRLTPFAREDRCRITLSAGEALSGGE